MKPLHRLPDEELTRLAVAAIRMPDAPGEWVQAATALWHAASPFHAAVEQPTLLNRIKAVLSFDNWAAASLALGVRSVPGGSRHLLYSARGRDIDVRIAPTADTFSLAGQVLGPDESGEVELMAAGSAGRRVTQLDSLGEFHVDGLDAGTYQLRLRMGRDEIVLPPIVIGERPS
jgi:hypothetical protein